MIGYEEFIMIFCGVNLIIPAMIYVVLVDIRSILRKGK